MTVYTEGRHYCEGIIAEANGFFSRDDVTYAASQTIVPGSVLGKVTASGQYAVFNPAAVDGTQTAVAVALYPVTTGAGQTDTGVALTRDCEFRIEALMWKTGLQASDITAAIAQLKAPGIIIRA